VFVLLLVAPAAAGFADEWRVLVGASRLYWSSGLSEPHTNVAPTLSLVYAWREAFHVKMEAVRADGDFTGFRAPDQHFTTTMFSLIVAPRFRVNERFAGVVTLGASHVSNSGDLLADEAGLSAGLGVEIGVSQRLFCTVEGRAMLWENDSGASYENPRLFVVAGLGMRFN
jgi:hypothetical protein